MKYLLIALTLAVTISCTKNTEKPAASQNPGAVAVRLQLGGELTASEIPLPNGRRAGGSAEYAKTLRDSTIYAIYVYKQNGWRFEVFSSGLFNQKNSITLLLPAQGYFRLSAYAIKKGTGEGLFYTMQGTQQYFPRPIDAGLANEMDSLHREQLTRHWDTLSGMLVADPANLQQSLPVSSFPELDAFHGDSIFSMAEIPATISLPMRRVAFGIRFSATNFTSGKLVMDFPDVFSPQTDVKTVTPANINTRMFIHASDLFKFPQWWHEQTMKVRMKWEKTDGSTVVLGEKTVNFKRNVMTTLAVTIPGPGRNSAPAGITVTESSLSN